MKTQIVKLPPAAEVLLSDNDRKFWLAVREGLLLIIRAVEERYLPGLKKALQ